ncbi:MAG: hypothetical protein K9M75_07840 [Phycisphaerae bacterium]|nr:hypothetical protein [Phycisphaerae bacterium]
MGSGSSSILQAQSPVIATVDFNYVSSLSISEQVKVCAKRKEFNMEKQRVTNSTGVKRISVTAKFKLRFIVAVAILVLGYGDGFSPSAFTYLEVSGLVKNNSVNMTGGYIVCCYY